ncbi:hypothetical protein A3736_09765 [Erythrobacter sp. HI0063]|uniref:hypothetical protein n=1 Tax=Erythrobacter sp. HI0063 TaxID=1822240 RepID=UPI0007C306DD|nr:hypothetical protein [Erythrobacter sp. HI0063]KZY55755.1 hypothetical protein A3736_09765 [Erythrobacter sp. HI0063]
MPWARIPCDKLATINLFGYTLEHEDGRNLWYRDADGELFCVDRHAPRFFFDSVGEAMQAGATAVRITSEREAEEMDDLNAQAEAEANSMKEAEGSEEAE